MSASRVLVVLLLSHSYIGISVDNAESSSPRITNAGYSEEGSCTMTATGEEGGGYPPEECRGRRRIVEEEDDADDEESGVGLLQVNKRKPQQMKPNSEYRIPGYPPAGPLSDTLRAATPPRAESVEEKKQDEALKRLADETEIELIETAARTNSLMEMEFGAAAARMNSSSSLESEEASRPLLLSGEDEEIEDISLSLLSAARTASQAVLGPIRHVEGQFLELVQLRSVPTSSIWAASPSTTQNQQGPDLGHTTDLHQNQQGPYTPLIGEIGILIFAIFAYFYYKNVVEEKRKVPMNGVLEAAKLKGEDFNDSPFDCFRDTATCLHGCCCVGVRAADNLATAGVMDFWPACCLCTCCVAPSMGLLVPWIFISAIVAHFRGKLRQKYEGKPCDLVDCCWVFWCWPCTVCQEARHVDLNAEVRIECCCKVVDLQGQVVGPPLQVRQAAEGSPLR